MSNLWIQTTAESRIEPWHALDTAKKRPDLVQRIMDGHGLEGKLGHVYARNALNTVGRHLYSGQEYMHPVDYGKFASAPKQKDPDYSLLPDEATDEDPWHDRPVQDVPIGIHHPVHALQGFLYTRGVAHALLWPGRRQDLMAHGNPKVGHPDIEPTAYGDDDPSRAPTDASRLVRKHNGLWVVDGHHRIAADLMLRKDTTPARLADISEFQHR